MTDCEHGWDPADPLVMRLAATCPTLLARCTECGNLLFDVTGHAGPTVKPSTWGYADS